MRNEKTREMMKQNHTKRYEAERNRTHENETRMNQERSKNEKAHTQGSALTPFYISSHRQLATCGLGTHFTASRTFHDS